MHGVRTLTTMSLQHFFYFDSHRSTTCPMKSLMRFILQLDFPFWYKIHIYTYYNICIHTYMCIYVYTYMYTCAKRPLSWIKTLWSCMMKRCAKLRTSFVSKPQGQSPELCSVGGGGFLWWGLDDLVVFHGKSENPHEMRVFFFNRWYLVS